MLIKDISTVLVENKESLQLPSEFEQKMLKSALETRAKVSAGEMKTRSLKDAKSSINARN